MLEKVKFEGEFASTKFAKNLFLYDKKKKERIWLVIAAHDTQFAMKFLEKHLKCSSGSLRGADAELLESLLLVKGGSVNLFSIMNDPEKKVHVILDKTLFDNQFVGFHPMQNDYTTAIGSGDMRKILSLAGRSASDFTELDFASLEQAQPAAENNE